MRWFRMFRKPDPEAVNEANKALAHAENNLRKTQQRSAEVSELAGDIRRYREENGFSHAFRVSMRRI